MTKEVVQSFDMTQVDGVKVEQRTSAKNTRGNAPGSLLPDVDEVLLSNGGIVYQCVSRAGGCGKTWETAQQVVSHLKVHQGRIALARTQQELADLQEKIAADERAAREKRSAAGRKAVAAREAKKATRPTVKTDAEKDLQMARRAAMDEIDRGWDLVDEGRKAIEAGALTLAELSRPTDPELVEKAAKWDNMKRMLS